MINTVDKMTTSKTIIKIIDELSKNKSLENFIQIATSYFCDFEIFIQVATSYFCHKNSCNNDDLTVENRSAADHKRHLFRLITSDQIIKIFEYDFLKIMEKDISDRDVWNNRKLLIESDFFSCTTCCLNFNSNDHTFYYKLLIWFLKDIKKNQEYPNPKTKEFFNFLIQNQTPDFLNTMFDRRAVAVFTDGYVLDTTDYKCDLLQIFTELDEKYLKIFLRSSFTDDLIKIFTELDEKYLKIFLRSSFTDENVPEMDNKFKGLLNGNIIEFVFDISSVTNCDQWHKLYYCLISLLCKDKNIDFSESEVNDLNDDIVNLFQDLESIFKLIRHLRYLIVRDYTEVTTITDLTDDLPDRDEPINTYAEIYKKNAIEIEMLDDDDDDDDDD